MDEGCPINYPDPIIDCTSKEIYYPSDDSYLIIDYLKEHVDACQFDELGVDTIKNVLDLGTGSGIIAIFLGLLKRINPQFNPRIVASDIQTESIHCAKFNQIANGLQDEIEFIHSDLFRSFPNQMRGLFNIIIFNPPYLPSITLSSGLKEKGRGDPCWDGGITGLEVIESFLNEAKKYLSVKEQWHVYFISSSRTNLKELDLILERNGFKNEIRARKHLFFENILLNRCSLLH